MVGIYQDRLTETLRGSMKRIIEVLKAVRSRDTRGFRMLRYTLMSIFTRGTGTLANFFILPFMVSYLGPDRYGVWATLSSLMIWFSLADGGVTAGATALIAHAHGADDRIGVRKLLSTTYAAASSASCIIALIALYASPHIDFGWALNISSPQLQMEARDVANVILYLGAMSFPTAVAIQARTALQQGDVAKQWEFISTILTICAQVISIYTQSSMVIVVFATLGIRPIINSVASLYFFNNDGIDIRPHWKFVEWRVCQRLYVSGSIYLTFISLQALAVQSDQILVAHLLNIESVTDYYIVQKILTAPSLVTDMYLLAQMPAYGEAFARGDFRWVRRHFIISNIIIITFNAFVSCVIVAVLDKILAAWMGEAIDPSPLLVTSMAVYGAVSAVAHGFTGFFYMATIHRMVLFGQLGMVVINLPLAIILIPKIGSAGAVIATSIGYSIAVIAPGIWRIISLFRDFSEVQTRLVGQGSNKSPALTE
ncbi:MULTISPECIES: lipopolysaccharide biosynthesis protein [unclassified Methylosinus]|uniref:lipopolysaccharide biosynthesis protein n=1 Tax=unclassified Methylosinus TaxID=2624500 RepID=UPI000A5AC274|nr:MULTISPECIES: hypothetical protein [unclassified Methylosinus]